MGEAAAALQGMVQEAPVVVVQVEGRKPPLGVRNNAAARDIVAGSKVGNLDGKLVVGPVVTAIAVAELPPQLLQ